VTLFAATAFHYVTAGGMGVHSAFLSLVTLTFDYDSQTRPSENQTRLSCEFGANPFSGSRDFDSQTK